MPRLTETQIETLTYCIEKSATAEGRILTAWEQKFLVDQADRFEQYGEQTAFSPRSWEIVEKIETALINQTPTRRK